MMFAPIYTITSCIANALMRIEAVKQSIATLPITPSVLKHLQETARLYATHYSTQIEGNRLTQKQVDEVIQHHEHFPGRERDEAEIKGYYIALDKLEVYVNQQKPINEKMIQTLHALVMAGGRTRVKATHYRDGQNVIRDGVFGRIVYMPPEAKDVSQLMHELIVWINKNDEIPCPIIASIAHYQFATIHPYYDGNGRTARLLATLILRLGGYDLKGLYALEEYYAKSLPAYYEALNVGSSHNYYMGRAESDITHWVEYFCLGMQDAFQKVEVRAKEAETAGFHDQSALLRELDVKQRKALSLFQKHKVITSKEVADLFHFKPRTARELCHRWVAEEFLVMVDPSKKSRKYRLGDKYITLV